MIMLVMVPLVLAFAWMCRFGGRDNFRSTAAVARKAPPAVPPGDDLIAADTAWTALDDIQLNRLLKESSP
jgi:hypothetical protein